MTDDCYWGVYRVMERRNVYYKVLEHPVVQYITLRKRTLHEEILDDRVINNNNVDIRIIQNQLDLNNFIRFHRINYFNEEFDFASNMLIISVNYSIDDTKYRTNRIYIFGNIIKGKIQISRISKDLIYRKEVYLLPYTWEGEKIPLRKQVYVLN